MSKRQFHRPIQSRSKRLLNLHLCIRQRFRRQHLGHHSHRLCSEFNFKLIEDRIFRKFGLNHIAHDSLRIGLKRNLLQRKRKRHGQSNKNRKDKKVLKRRVARAKAGAKTISARHHPSCQSDGDKVGHIQHQRAGKDRPIQCRKAKTHHSQRRHQGRSNRHAHNRAITPPDHRIGPGKSRKQRNK